MPKAKLSEKFDVQMPLARIIRNSGCEVLVEASSEQGRVDILTDSELIECKTYLTKSSFYKAIGQLLVYSESHPGRSKVIAVGELPSPSLLLLARRCNIGVLHINTKVVSYGSFETSYSTQEVHTPEYWRALIRSCRNSGEGLRGRHTQVCDRNINEKFINIFAQSLQNCCGTNGPLDHGSEEEKCYLGILSFLTCPASKELLEDLMIWSCNTVADFWRDNGGYVFDDTTSELVCKAAFEMADECYYATRKKLDSFW